MITEMATTAPKLKSVVQFRPRDRHRLYLAEWRDHCHLSVEALAKLLRVSRQTVYRYEKDLRKVNADKMVAIAAALNIEPWRLWLPPEFLSLDAELAHATPEQRRLVLDLARTVAPHQG